MKMKCKVWNSSRTLKKMILVDCDEADALKAVLDKGAVKCQIDSESVRLVLERDGTEVDDSEVFLECLKDTDTFVILGADDSWYPAVYELPTICTVRSDEQVTPESNEPIEADLEHQKPSGPEGEKESIPAPLPGRLPPSSRDRVTRDTPVPQFSDFVIKHLEQGQTMVVWSRIIHQCAEYYLIHYPNMSDAGEYQAVGEKLYSMYPGIKQEGKYPWSMFCKDLSQRIRWLRWNRKRKSTEIHAAPVASSAKSFQVIDLTSGQSDTVGESSTQDYESNVLQLKKETSKRVVNSATVTALLTETHDLRVAWIKSLTDGRISPILEKFPVFQFGFYVMKEFELLMSGTDAVESMFVRLDHFAAEVENLMGEKQTGELRMLTILRYVEENVRLEKGKGQKSVAIVTEEKNIPDEEKAPKLVTRKEEAPRLVVFTKQGQFEEASVVADEVVLLTETKTVAQAVIFLMAVYYSFHLSYPRVYSQLLGIIQEYVVHEPYGGLKSKKYKLFCNKINGLLRK